MSPALANLHDAVTIKARAARDHATRAADDLVTCRGERSLAFAVAQARSAQRALESTIDLARAALADLGPFLDQLSIRDGAEGDSE